MSSARRIYISLYIAVALLAVAIVVTMLNGSSRPKRSSANYEAYTHAFQLGVAALDSDLLPQAEENLKRCTQLIPKEPAAWANLGLLYMRTGRLDEADDCLQHAEQLSPTSNAIKKIIAHLRTRQGRFDDAAARLREVLEQDANDARSLYQLVQLIDQQSQSSAAKDQLALFERLLVIQPTNSRLLVDKLRLAIKLGDANQVKSAKKGLEQLKPLWQSRTVNAWDEYRRAAEQNAGQANQSSLLRFTNTLLAESSFVRDSAQLESPEAFVGESLPNYLWLDPIKAEPAAADLTMTFKRLSFGETPWRVYWSFWNKHTDKLDVVGVREEGLQFNKSLIAVDSKKLPQSTSELICFDSNNDMLVDVMIACPGGLLYYPQLSENGIQSATADMKLDETVLNAAYDGGCAVDYDQDGDMDVLIYAQRQAPIVLRNNFDGTFTALSPFPNANAAKSSTWGDFDSDGAIDVALLNVDGELQVFSNQRSGKFTSWLASPPSDKLIALTSADVTQDGQLDIITVSDQGKLLAISDVSKQSSWTKRLLGEVDARKIAPQELSAAQRFELHVGDLDNNGSTDLVLSSTESHCIWLSEPNQEFKLLDTKLALPVLQVIDVYADGRLDLITHAPDGIPRYLKSSGQKNYGWIALQPQASRGKVDGDNRINSFGIGGTIELRAGSFLTSQVIQSPRVHLGLGNNDQADFVRVLWPNGTFQYEFPTASKQTVVATQRLKGSCPFLFARKGEQFQFVTDFMWSTPLGMYINASDKGGFLQTTDWVKISSDQLSPVEHIYELRVNANLWETHYFDHLALTAVDHPVDVHLVIDEKFFLEPAAPKLHWTTPPRNIQTIIDQDGKDVSSVLSTVDAKYLDVGPRGRYQGLTDEHWIEFKVPSDTTRTPQYLLARGWIHPTDSSINFAIAQGQHPVPHGLILEVRSKDGNWNVVNDHLGFPAGKNKTIMVPLNVRDHQELADADGNLRFRLRTNLEIYWDWIGLAEPVDSTQHVEIPLRMTLADLRSRGIVEMTQANPSSPELPVYDRLIARGQYWRDLIGYHTRFGDIRELLHEVDDRYAILSAGDEVVLRFEAPTNELPTGWVRDFVWISDGWVKDGDLNTHFGKTVLPLPYHHMSEYAGDPNSLESDPVYQRFPHDWDEYHTRYIKPFEFDQGLRRFLDYRTEESRP